jgi:apolipoprotein N-acyltransferase
MQAILPIGALAERVRTIAGWRRRLVAVLAGTASALAMAPFHLWPVLWVTLPVLVWLIDAALASRAHAIETPWYARPMVATAEVGWLFGFGYFLAGLYWIGAAFLVEADRFAVFMPVAVLAMPAGLALFYAGAVALAAAFWRPGLGRVLVLALSLSAFEWLRGHVLSGFPWNVLGYALTYPDALMQSASVLGIYGLTLAAVLVFALPPVLWNETTGGPAGLRGRAAAVAIALAPLFVAGIAGHIRLTLAASTTVPDVKIRIVQPSVPQREKWIPANQSRFFQEHLDLSIRNPAGEIDNLIGVTVVIWPEAAMPFRPLETPQALAAIDQMLPEGVALIAGAVRAEKAPPTSPRLWSFFNSLLVFVRGRLLTRYDKIRLVPFGEFLPLRDVLGAFGLRQLAAMGSFETGETPRPLLGIPGLPAAVALICYEAIFPAAVAQGSERPGVIVNITNDGWFGITSGPYQHFHQARTRAVEEGLPLVRAANNGVSAVVDPYGRVLQRLDLEQRGVIDSSLPVALAQPPPYARFGDAIFAAIWLIGAAIFSMGRSRTP